MFLLIVELKEKILKKLNYLNVFSNVSCKVDSCTDSFDDDRYLIDVSVDGLLKIKRFIIDEMRKEFSQRCIDNVLFCL